MIYLDHAATTPVKKEVFDAMKPYFTEKYGNPSSIYEVGQVASFEITQARKRIADNLGANPDEIIFTSGATESNNLAIKGVVLKHKDTKPHIITSSIEHHSVLDTAKYLEDNFDIEVTYLSVDKEGLVNPVDVKKEIKKNTVLVSIMHANNEVGSIQPIEEISEVIKNAKDKRSEDLPLYFHTDAVQSFQYLDIDVEKLGVDMLSLTGHKFYGPKGAGILYVKKGTKILPQQQGGAQEAKRRAGTENVPYIIGMEKAMNLAVRNRDKEVKKVKALRDKLVKGIQKETPNVILAGSKDKRLPHNAAFLFKNVEGESILINLDMEGIAASSGSACTSGSLEPSHVLIAMGYDHTTAHGSIRFTLGERTTGKDIDTVVKKLPPIIDKLREMSPLK